MGRPRPERTRPRIRRALEHRRAARGRTTSGWAGRLCHLEAANRRTRSRAGVIRRARRHATVIGRGAHRQQQRLAGTAAHLRRGSGDGDGLEPCWPAERSIGPQQPIGSAEAWKDKWRRRELHPPPHARGKISRDCDDCLVEAAGTVGRSRRPQGNPKQSARTSLE